jgi:hypothetical protein
MTSPGTYMLFQAGDLSSPRVNLELRFANLRLQPGWGIDFSLKVSIMISGGGD